MKQLPLRFTKPPRAIQNARMENIALVPASLLLQEKDKYQTITRNLPKGSVLICDIAAKPRLQVILTRVAAFFRSHGHQVSLFPAASLTT